MIFFCHIFLIAFFSSDKGEVGNTIINTKGKTILPFFSAWNKYTGVNWYTCHEAITVRWQLYVYCILRKGVKQSCPLYLIWYFHPPPYGRGGELGAVQEAHGWELSREGGSSSGRPRSEDQEPGQAYKAYQTFFYIKKIGGPWVRLNIMMICLEAPTDDVFNIWSGITRMDIPI